MPTIISAKKFGSQADQNLPVMQTSAYEDSFSRTGELLGTSPEVGTNLYIPNTGGYAYDGYASNPPDSTAQFRIRIATGLTGEGTYAAAFRTPATSQPISFFTYQNGNNTVRTSWSDGGTNLNLFFGMAGTTYTGITVPNIGLPPDSVVFILIERIGHNSWRARWITPTDSATGTTDGSNLGAFDPDSLGDHIQTVNNAGDQVEHLIATTETLPTTHAALMTRFGITP